MSECICRLLKSEIAKLKEEMRLLRIQRNEYIELFLDEGATMPESRIKQLDREITEAVGRIHKEIQD